MARAGPRRQRSGPAPPTQMYPFIASSSVTGTDSARSPCSGATSPNELRRARSHRCKRCCRTCVNDQPVRSTRVTAGPFRNAKWQSRARRAQPQRRRLARLQSGTRADIGTRRPRGSPERSFLLEHTRPTPDELPSEQTLRVLIGDTPDHTSLRLALLTSSGTICRLTSCRSPTAALSQLRRPSGAAAWAARPRRQVAMSGHTHGSWHHVSAEP